MPSLKILPTPSLAQKVAARLHEAIAGGEFPPGSNIAEEMLAQEFGVSRTPVREALNQLRLQGLVVIRPQVGSFVFQPSASDIAVLSEFRLHMEPWAARLAYEHDPGKTIEGLKPLISRMQAAMLAKDHLAFARADTAFHDVFLTWCNNQYVQDSYALAAGRIAMLRSNFLAPVGIQSQRDVQEHQQLLELFAKGDFVGFAEITRVHVSESKDILMGILDGPSSKAKPQALSAKG